MDATNFAYISPLKRELQAEHYTSILDIQMITKWSTNNNSEINSTTTQ